MILDEISCETVTGDPWEMEIVRIMRPTREPNEGRRQEQLS